MQLSASAWNMLLDRLGRYWPQGYLAAEAGAWRHPWFTSPAWDGIGEQWTATVAPGFVNGQEVVVTVPPVGRPFDEPVAVPLTESPVIPLPFFRAIGGSGNVEAAGGEAVPAFFADLGVKGAEVVTIESLEEGAAVDITLERLAGVEGAETEDEPLPERLLRACDIVLRHTRARTVIDWQLGVGLDGTAAQFTVGSSGGSAGEASLRVVSRYQAASNENNLDALAGTVEDPGYDEAKVCTVFLLSPPDVPADAEPDATWSPYVKHALFWNAQYITTQPGVAPTKQNLEINLAGLGNAAGAQITVNQMLATQNDAFAAALEFLNAKEIKGLFFTAGSRQAAEPVAEGELDPPFPYFGLPFNPEFLK